MAQGISLSSEVWQGVQFNRRWISPISGPKKSERFSLLDFIYSHWMARRESAALTNTLLWPCGKAALSQPGWWSASLHESLHADLCQTNPSYWALPASDWGASQKKNTQYALFISSLACHSWINAGFWAGNCIHTRDIVIQRKQVWTVRSESMWYFPYVHVVAEHRPHQPGSEVQTILSDSVWNWKNNGGARVSDLHIQPSFRAKSRSYIHHEHVHFSVWIRWLVSWRYCVLVTQMI